MKAISLWQPWASLIAVGAKHIETRHWQPPRALIGQRVAIHAGKRLIELGLLGHPAFAHALAGYPIHYGAIVCTARLANVEPITPDLCRSLSDNELAFGDYHAGRYAWHLHDVHPLAVPVPTIGRQGFFDVPDPRAPDPARQAEWQYRHGYGDIDAELPEATR